MSNVVVKPKRLPPLAARLHLVGALPWLVRDGFDFLLRARDSCGDVYRVDLGVRDVVLVSHPDHAQQVLCGAHATYTRGGPIFEGIREFLGESLFYTEGHHWRQQRRTMNPLFARDALVGLTEPMARAAADALAAWDTAAATGEPLNVTKASTFVTASVLSRSVFGGYLTPEEGDRAEEDLRVVTRYLVLGAVTERLPRLLVAPWRNRFHASVASLDDLLRRVMARRSGARMSGSGHTLMDVLAGLLDPETGSPISADELRNTAMTFFAGGFETASKSLAWTLQLLSRHPASVERLQREVDTVLGGRLPSYGDLPDLPFTRMVICESLRLYPTVYQVYRIAAEDGEIGGFFVPRGTLVGVLSASIHRHPDVWERPDSFEPERFLPEAVSTRHRLAWMPFGAGPHLCIAKEFALMELQIILALAMQRYDVGPALDLDARPTLGAVVLTSDRPISVRLRPRRAPDHHEVRSSAAPRGRCPFT